MAKREMNAVSGRMTLKKISLASASVFSTVLVIRVAAYLQSEIMFKINRLRGIHWLPSLLTRLQKSIYQKGGKKFYWTQKGKDLNLTKNHHF